MAKYLGEAVVAGRNTAMGYGCQWMAADGTGHVIVSIAASNFYAPPSAVEGFKELNDVGTRGYIAPAAKGWSAGAITGEKHRCRVSRGRVSDRSEHVALLKNTIQRHGS